MIGVRVSRGLRAAEVEIPSWADARALHANGAISDAELACLYVAERVRRAAGPRWRQAERKPAIVGPGASPWVRLVAERELYRVPPVVPEALVGWAAGERPVEMYFHKPTSREVLALQARGRRCVSLLDEGVPTAPHADGLAFAVHDLCHLEKFVNPEHHRGQVGFFDAMNRALDDARWAALEAPFDATWAFDRDYVISDMNGSVAFLFVTLRGKLKLAVRRWIAAERGDERVAYGALDEEEARRFAEAFEVVLDLLELRGHVRDAARVFSSRHDDVEAAARVIVGHFEAAGDRVLQAGSKLPCPS